jgi:hypothetical protein
MFGELLREIRAAVISRMYMYHPRQAAANPIEPVSMEAVPSSGAAPSLAAGQETGQVRPAGKKKRKRH